MKKFPVSPIRTITPLALAVSVGLSCFLNASMAQNSSVTAKESKPKPSADELAWIDELTAIPPGARAGLEPVSVEFSLSWNNVLNAGEMALALDHGEDAEKQVNENILIGTASGRSSGLARVLWPYDFEASAVVDTRSLRPNLFELSETERGKTVNYQLEFQPGRVVSETTVLPEKESEEAETRRKVYRYDFLHDVLSIALYVRSHELTEGETVKALVSPFNRPYHVEFEMAGKETRKVRREKYETIKYEVAIRKVNHDQTLQDYDKMKKATIWFSDDEFRLPLEVHADIFVGFVSARMKERAWLADTAVAEKEKKGGLKGFFEGTRKSILGKSGLK